MDNKVMDFRIQKWLELLNDQANSGLSKAMWCAQNNISLSRFFRWQSKCRAYLLENPSAIQPFESSDEFVDITPVVSQGKPVVTSSNLHIKFNNYDLDLDVNVDENTLLKVFKVLAYVNK